jgi:hypothetical protein
MIFDFGSWNVDFSLLFFFRGAEDDFAVSDFLTPTYAGDG